MSIQFDSVTLWVPAIEANPENEDCAKINAQRNMIVSTYYANLPSTITNQLNNLIHSLSLGINTFFPHTGLFFSDIAIAAALARW